MSVPARLRFYSKLREQPFIVLKEVPHEMVQRASYCNTSTPMSGGAAAAWDVKQWVKLFRVAAHSPLRRSQCCQKLDDG